jgi:uncharacterized protein
MNAVVTGASSGIGRAVALDLLAKGYRVFGIGRTVDSTLAAETAFTPLRCDLARTEEIETCLTPLLAEKDVSLLVNAAGFGRFDPHETLTPALIAEMTSVNLTAPMVLSSLLLRSLKANEGAIINITSIEALRASKFAALYSATKAGLRAFGQSLFEEVRKAGVNVVTVNPDMTDTPFFDALRFGPGETEDTRLLAEDIARVLELILAMRPGAAVTELTIRPQRFGITKKPK